MREQDFFALTAQLRDEQIAEAVTWRHRADAAQEQPPAEASLTGSAPASLGEFFGTEEAKPVQIKEEAYTSGSSREEMSPKQLRQMGFGVAAIAACLVLTVGGLAWKTYRENAGVPVATPPHSSVADSTAVSDGSTGTQHGSGTLAAQQTTTLTTADDIAVQTVPASQVPDGYGVPSAESIRITEAVVAYAEPYVEPVQPQPNSEPNIFGGTGALIPITEGNLGIEGMVADNDYYYFRNYRVSKATGEQSRRCTDPDCEHRTKACLENSYPAYSLYSDGEQLYYTFGSNTLFTIEQDGTLNRFLKLEYDPEGNPISGLNINITGGNFTTVRKLCDGIYFIRGYYLRENESAKNIPVPVQFSMIYTPETGKIIWLPEQYSCNDPVYVPEYRLLITASLRGSGYPDEAESDTFYEIDIDTGAVKWAMVLPLRQRTQELRWTQHWTVWQGKLYFTETQDNFATYDLSCIDLSTTELKLLKQDCGYSWFGFAGDKMYWLERTQHFAGEQIICGDIDGKERSGIADIPDTVPDIRLCGDTLCYSEFYHSDSKPTRWHFLRLDTGENIIFDDTES